jgi:cytochrome P450
MSSNEPCRIGLSALVEAYRDPHSLYDAARKQGGICFDPVSKCWLITDYSAVRRILGDPRFSSDLSRGSRNAPQASRPSFIDSAIRRQILFSDGEDHERVQEAILRESTRRGHSIRPLIRQIADRLLEPARLRGRIDLVRDFSAPFAAEAISLIMGIPLEDDRQRDQLQQWSNTFGAVTSGYFRVRVQEIERLGAFFRDLVRSRKTHPSDDLVQTLIDDRVFDDEEDLVINCMMVFGAGRATTQKLLGDGVAKLLPEWGRWRELNRENPGTSRRLAEELLRAVTPTRHLARYAVETVDLADEFPGDHRIREGERVILFLEAANRDGRTFASPHSLVVDRQPNPHVAFGFGAHRCPGAGLARIEIQVALDGLFETFGELRPDPAAQPEWDPNPNLGGYQSFPCVCG